jgi:hypothetical protein
LDGTSVTQIEEGFKIQGLQMHPGANTSLTKKTILDVCNDEENKRSLQDKYLNWALNRRLLLQENHKLKKNY